MILALPGPSQGRSDPWWRRGLALLTFREVLIMPVASSLMSPLIPRPDQTGLNYALWSVAHSLGAGLAGQCGTASSMFLPLRSSHWGPPRD